VSAYTHPSRCFTMPSGVPFLASLARGLTDHLGDDLGRALILLPTRRAVRTLGDAFVEIGDGKAAILPRMRPLADIEADDVSYDPTLATAERMAAIGPAISPLQRRFELARLITLYHRRSSDIPLSAASAMAMAEPLAAILDDAAMEEADLPSHELLEEIRARAAEHFQHTSMFYEILRTFWPERLRELGFNDPKARQVDMLDALREEWDANPPDFPVVAAGSTGTLNATARLIACIRQLPRGTVVLPGVDLNLRSDAAWDAVDCQHPQHSLKNLLNLMKLGRDDIANWPAAALFNSDPLKNRRRILSEALVPVTAAKDWPQRIQTMKSQKIDFADAAAGLSLIEARHEEEEALSIALILREALETPDKTAILVTPDSGLARRVRTRLARWNVAIDFTQGQPLEETARGAYLSGLMQLAVDTRSAVNLAYIAKHAMTGLGLQEGQARANWMAVERKFRGANPSDEERRKIPVLNTLLSTLEPLTDIATATPDGWARALARTVEAIAATDSLSGAQRMWADDSGEALASLIEDIIQYGDLLDPIDAAGFHDLLLSLIKERVVRSAPGTHPRLKILGPLEARMLTADTIVLGGLNEGVWPILPSPTPYLSREMRSKLGLSLPERRFGLSAHDFAQLAAHPRVVLTRSERTADGPMVASRWVWRLKTLMRGALGDDWKAALEPEQDYLDWARRMDAWEDKPEPAQRPAPTPPVAARWPDWTSHSAYSDKGGRRLSITQIKRWVRDPYSIYCTRVLGLDPLPPLDVSTEVRDWGTMIHGALEAFFKEVPHDTTLSGSASQRLSDLLETHLVHYGFPTTDLAKERVRMARLADKVVAWARARREDGWQVVSIEQRGELHLAEVDFALSGKADLIESGPNGYAVIDFKTGTPPTHSVVAAGFDPQLPLTAVMLAEGDVGDLAKGRTDDLIYAEIKGYNDKEIQTSLVEKSKDHDADSYAANARSELIKLIREFDKPDTAYHSQPRRQYTDDWSDFDTLARRGEWAEAGPDASDTGGSHGG